MKGLYSLSQESVNVRLTWQANQKNKFSGFYDNQWRCWCKRTLANISPESDSTYNFPIENMASFSWSSPLTSRLLIDASLSSRGERFAVQKPAIGDPFRTLIPVTEQSTGLLYRGVGTAVATQPFIANTTSPSNAQASLTFVTGSHALKLGFNDTWGGRHATYDSPADVGLTYRFNTVNGVTTPNLIATPVRSENLKANQGIFAQGQMDGNGSLNLGVADYFNDYFPESSLGRPLVPTRNLTSRSLVRQLERRLPAPGRRVYVFSSRKTAVPDQPGQIYGRTRAQGAYGDQADPLAASNMITRSWNDSFFPTGDPRRSAISCRLRLTNPLNNECIMSNAARGTYDDTTRRHWWAGRSSRQLGVLDQYQHNRPARVDGVGSSAGNSQLHGDRQSVDRSTGSVRSASPPADPRLPGGSNLVSGL